jgi:hypothetical protein
MNDFSTNNPLPLGETKYSFPLTVPSCPLRAYLSNSNPTISLLEIWVSPKNITIQ